MGGKVSDFLIPAAIGSIALAPMLFPALGAAGGIIGPSLAGGAFGAGAAGPPAAALAGGGLSGLGGLMGAMNNPLFKFGSSMLMNQMGQQPQTFPMAPPRPLPAQALPPSGGSLAGAASAIPQMNQPGVGGGGYGMGPMGGMPGFGPLPIPPWGRTSIG